MHNRSEFALFSKPTNESEVIQRFIRKEIGSFSRNAFGPKFGASLLYVCTTTGETVTSKPFAEVTRSEYEIRKLCRIYSTRQTRCREDISYRSESMISTGQKQCQGIIPLLSRVESCSLTQFFSLCCLFAIYYL